MDTIICPHCKKRVELSQAIIHELSERVREEEKEKLIARFEEQKAKEQAQKEKDLRKEFERKSREKALELETAKKKEKILAEKISQQEKELEKEIEKARQSALKEAKRQAEEEVEIKLKQKDIQLEQIKKINQDLQRKVEQGSQQLQGEALEIGIEEKLRSAFPYDIFEPVPKGIKGGDILQNVRNKFGKTASVIIWEFKRTKTWDKNWLEKLRTDARTARADEAVIVSEILPDDLRIYQKIDGVWVTSRKYALPLATILREMGLRIAVAKSGAKHDDQALKAIYEYIMSVDFKHIVEMEVESVSKSIILLDKKHEIDDRYYKRQKLNLEALKENTSKIYFDLQKRLPTLPPIAGLEMDDLSDENKDDEQTLF